MIKIKTAIVIFFSVSALVFIFRGCYMIHPGLFLAVVGVYLAAVAKALHE
jgi:hypothetical protein